MTGSNPASFLGLKDRGQIEVSKRADISIIDIGSPEVVRAEDVRSKCGWSPYEGIEFPGRTRWTIRSGEPLLDDYRQVRQMVAAGVSPAGVGGALAAVIILLDPPR